jgi:opacity protein-like surface antigen
VAGHALWAPGRVFGLRLDGSFLIYGSETVPRPFRGTGGRVGLSVRTDNWIGTLALGPQLMARSGRVRPYANAFAGVSYFSTTSELLGPDELSVLASTTNHDDATFAYGGGAGVLFGLGSGEWALDLGARYVANGRVSYLAEGDLVEDRRGARFSPRRSEAETVEVRLGVVFRP